MTKRVSHSFLDPWIGPRIKSLYPHLHIPQWYPPEGIIAVGHALAILGAVGFSYSTEYWWGGLLIAVGALGNHFADCIDGTHARATGQCRNGGELLDHFTDPLSFAYWIVGWSISCAAWPLGMTGLICVYATAVLTSIRAKMVGEFTVSSFGPTEFKILLALYGIVLMILPPAWRSSGIADQIAFAVLTVMLLVGILQLVLNLIWAVHDVNTRGAAPDTSAWVTRDQHPRQNDFETITTTRETPRPEVVREQAANTRRHAWPSAATINWTVSSLSFSKHPRAVGRSIARPSWRNTRSWRPS